jgi:hypothetical protein
LEGATWLLPYRLDQWENSSLCTECITRVFRFSFLQIASKLTYPAALTIAGHFLIASLFLFIGPAPFIKLFLTNSIGLSYAVAVTLEFGAGPVMVSTFARVYKEAMLQNYSDDIRTYLVISGNKVDHLYILCKTFL